MILTRYMLADYSSIKLTSMPTALSFEKSRPIQVIPYQTRWPREYEETAKDLQLALGNTARYIDHIGSTSVPELQAKDVLDIQITVHDLYDPNIQAKLEAVGYTGFTSAYSDEFIGMETDSRDLEKRMIREKTGQRRMHIHIREYGRFNQRYPLLFRDYLRASKVTRQSYGLLKERLAQLFPESKDGYYFIKDPLMDMMFEAAEHWALHAGWKLRS